MGTFLWDGFIVAHGRTRQCHYGGAYENTVVYAYQCLK